MITPQQENRIRGAITRLAQTHEYRTLRQFFLAESASDSPDPKGLKRLVLDLLSARLDEEIDAAARTRKEEAGQTVAGGPVKFNHPMR